MLLGMDPLDKIINIVNQQPGITLRHLRDAVGMRRERADDLIRYAARHGLVDQRRQTKQGGVQLAHYPAS